MTKHEFHQYGERRSVELAINNDTHTSKDYLVIRDARGRMITMVPLSAVERCLEDRWQVETSARGRRMKEQQEAMRKHCFDVT